MEFILHNLHFKLKHVLFFQTNFFTAVIPLTGLFSAHVCPCTKTERGLTSPYIMFFFVFNDLRGFRFVHIGGIVIVAVLSWRHNNVVQSVSQMSNMTDTINQSYVKTFLSIIQMRQSLTDW